LIVLKEKEKVIAYKRFEVIEEHCFADDVDTWSQYHPRIREVVEGVIETLSRMPKYGELLLERENDFVLQTNPVGSIPSFWILYHVDFTNEKVYLLSIHPVLKI